MFRRLSIVLGYLDAARAPILAGAVTDRVIGGAPQVPQQIKPLLRDAHPARKAVVDEHQRGIRVWMVGRRKPADLSTARLVR